MLSRSVLWCSMQTLLTLTIPLYVRPFFVLLSFLQNNSENDRWILTRSFVVNHEVCTLSCRKDMQCNLLLHRAAVYKSSSLDDHSRRSTVSKHTQDFQQHPVVSACLNTHQCLVYRRRIRTLGMYTITHAARVMRIESVRTTMQTQSIYDARTKWKPVGRIAKILQNYSLTR